jgi:hypothetical protein
MPKLTREDLFWKLYKAKNEEAVENVIKKYSEHFGSNWRPLGGNESNFGVVENQQSNPVAALVEKLTNSIDAILMRRCYEEGIDPKSPSAPLSIDTAIERFFPDHKNWDLSNARNSQAEHIQILADSKSGDTSDTSIIIYDDGEGQHPHHFEDTFLSLLRGNKNEIHFVQGKYNMGGSGAIVFCGKKRYQLIASKRYDATGEFGFTLIRKHSLSPQEAQTKKNTWYEYLVIDGDIPSFAITDLDLGLHNRLFRTGTIIKLYSYDTKGNRNLRRDMSRSLNEFLYEPALPIYVVESAERYPNERNLRDVVFGLKRQLVDNDYIETTFSEVISDKLMGHVKVTVHVFKVRAKGKKPKDTKQTIQNEYFKNNMAVLFSVNGQVHGHYTSEFITRTLKFNLLRDYLLIHVDCTDMKFDFRNELFMASRDRLKQGEESKYLRKQLGDDLSKGELRDVYRRRKDNISVEHVEQDSLLKNFAENLPINPDLRNLLSRTFKLDSTDQQKSSKKQEPSTPKPTPKKSDFNPQRFPSFFEFGSSKNGTHEVIKIPLNGSKTVQFDSDVESQYFDRVEDPGDMQIAIMNHVPNDNTGGNTRGTVNDISDVLTVNRKSPNEGKIKVVLKSNEDVQVGDEIQVKVDLHSPAAPEGTFQHIFWVKVTDPLPDKPEKVPMPEEEEKLGLPNYVLVFQSAPEDQPEVKTWKALQDNGIEMDYETVMYPDLGGDILETIYINMDSAVYKNHLSGYRNLTVEQEQLARNKYISSVYFHTLFLYVINKKRGYIIAQEQENGNEPKDVDMGEYLRDVFTSYYAAFLLNFGTSELMEGLG